MDRLFEAVMEDFTAYPDDYPRQGMGLAGRERAGEYRPAHSTLLILPQRLKKVAVVARIEDPEAALRELRRDDRLVAPKGRLQSQARLEEVPVARCC